MAPEDNEQLLVRQTIKGRRIKPVGPSPSGRTYPVPGLGKTVEADTQRDYEWLLALRMRGG